MPSSPYVSFLAFTPTFKPQFLITTYYFSNMHSYKTLAVLALAVSTASPAFAAPVVYAPYFSTLGTALADERYHRSRDGQQQARADIDERASAIPSGLGKDVGGLLKTIGTNLAFGALPVALEHFLGGNSTRRALPSDAPLDKRAPGVAGLFDDLLTSLKSSGSLGSVIKNGLIGGVASGAGAIAATDLLNNTR